MKKQAESVCKSGGVTSGYYAPVNIWNSKRSGPDGGCAVLCMTGMPSVCGESPHRA